jgi:hypothetical protein
MKLIFNYAMIYKACKLRIYVLYIYGTNSNIGFCLCVQDVTKLNPLSPEVICKQATINIGNSIMLTTFCISIL